MGAHEQALEHPYVEMFHNPDDEPVASRPVQICIDDNQKYSIDTAIQYCAVCAAVGVGRAFCFCLRGCACE